MDLDGWEDRARRFLHIVFSVAALVCLAPVMVAVALAILVESGRPIFFSQTRLGKDGRHFRLHKFRKFSARAGRDGPAVTVRGDARMTRVGQVLERTKLDELPQLWNILVGDMAIVGPRPESLAFSECFGNRYWDVLSFKPGIFGPCQVMFRNEGRLYSPGCEPELYYSSVLFPLKAHADLAYFTNRTASSDLRCVVHGTLAVFGVSSLSCETLPTLPELDALVRRLGHRRGDRGDMPAAPDGLGSDV